MQGQQLTVERLRPLDELPDGLDLGIRSQILRGLLEGRHLHLVTMEEVGPLAVAVPGGPQAWLAQESPCERQEHHRIPPAARMGHLPSQSRVASREVASCVLGQQQVREGAIEGLEDTHVDVGVAPVEFGDGPALRIANPQVAQRDTESELLQQLLNHRPPQGGYGQGKALVEKARRPKVIIVREHLGEEAGSAGGDGGSFLHLGPRYPTILQDRSPELGRIYSQNPGVSRLEADNAHSLFPATGSRRTPLAGLFHLDLRPMQPEPKVWPGLSAVGAPSPSPPRAAGPSGLPSLPGPGEQVGRVGSHRGRQCGSAVDDRGGGWPSLPGGAGFLPETRGPWGSGAGLSLRPIQPRLSLSGAIGR